MKKALTTLVVALLVIGCDRKAVEPPKTVNDGHLSQTGCHCSAWWLTAAPPGDTPIHREAVAPHKNDGKRKKKRLNCHNSTGYRNFLPTMSITLLPKRKHFADEYLVDSNATRAATAAGYSAHSAYSQGCRLLKDVEIAAYIAAARKAITDKLQIRQEDVIMEAGRIALVDPAAFFKEDGTALLIHELSRDVRACIARWRVITTGRKTTTEIWLHPKGPMIELLGRHFKIFEDLTPGGDGATNSIDLDALEPTDLKTLLEIRRKALRAV